MIIERYEIPETFIVLDLETTGLEKYEDEIIEVAAIKIKFDGDFKEIERLNYLVFARVEVPEEIETLTGITQKMIDAEGIEEEEAVNLLSNFINDYPIVCYNSAFDKGFLDEFFDNYQITLNNQFICAYQLIRKIYPDLSNYKLSSVCDYFNLKIKPSHRALNDCFAAFEVFKIATSGLNDLADELEAFFN